MFTKETVFVLGAGASWHYGYPTGEELVDRVIQMSDALAAHCRWRLSNGLFIDANPVFVATRADRSKGIDGARVGWIATLQECERLSARLRAVRPLVIDYFLAWNLSLQEIGKLMIAAVILTCEAQREQDGGNRNRRLILANQPIPVPFDLRTVDVKKFKDEWCRFVVHKLVYGCTDSHHLCENKVRFITFNYDTSLERYLYLALSSIDILKDEDIKQFLTSDRIVHVYGSVNEGFPPTPDCVHLATAETLGNSINPSGSLQTLRNISEFLDRSFKASSSIFTVDPHEKLEAKDKLEVARSAVRDANVIYILGYGFDANNNQRIGLTEYLSHQVDDAKLIMFTNFGDVTSVNKRASNLIFGHGGGFRLDGSGYTSTARRYEKSVKDVYESLAADFGDLESETIPEFPA